MCHLKMNLIMCEAAAIGCTLQMSPLNIGWPVARKQALDSLKIELAIHGTRTADVSLCISVVGSSLKLRITMIVDELFF
jgi:hypothetical protein